MATTEYQARYQGYVSAVEQRLLQLCDQYLPASARIGQAARYSLLGGGKRVRAVLTMASCEVCGKDPALALDYACALEMLHCYSLIHDDLPCMDNDDTRRGRPSCHRQYDESTALLAADALVTAAFEVIANTPLSAESRVHAAACLAKAGGARGMLYGQELDKKYEQEKAGEEQLFALHRHKTGALIVAAAELGCIAADAPADRKNALTRYAAGIGLVFQIVDDMLDVTATTEELGKPVGSDEANDKTTFVTLYGLGGAEELAKQNNQDSLQALDPLGADGWFLRELAQQLLQRRK